MIHFFSKWAYFLWLLANTRYLIGWYSRHFKIILLLLSESVDYFFVFQVESLILIFEWRLNAVKKNQSVKSLDNLIFNYRSVLGRGTYWKNYICLMTYSGLDLSPRRYYHPSPTSMLPKKLCQHRLSIGIQMCNLWDRETFNRFFFWYHFGDRVRIEPVTLVSEVTA